MVTRTAEEQAAVEATRKAIGENTVKTEKDDDGNVVEKKEVEVKSSEAKTEKEIEVIDEAKEETEEKIEKSEKTEEELEAEKATATTEKEKSRVQKKIDKEVAKRKTLEEEVATLKAQLAAKETDGEDKFTKEDVAKEAKRIAQEEMTQRDFDNACARLTKDAEKVDKDFVKKINKLCGDTAPIPGHMIGILDDLDNGGQILQHFTGNEEEYERIIELSPAKAAVELTKLSVKLAKPPEPKKLSKVPEPIDPIGGNSKVENNKLPENPTKNMDQFVRIRAAQVEERRKRQLAGIR